MQYEELSNKFHYISGTLIAGQIFLEYSLFLKETYNHKVRGDTTRFNRLTEAERKVNRLLKYLKEDLIAIGCDLDICQEQIDSLEKTFYDVLSLSEEDQIKVNELINQLKQEKSLEIA